MEALSISSALFSKVQQRVLALIFGQPERSFYTSEIVRTIKSGTGAVERELSRLRRSGLVSVENIGNQKHYRVNQKSPIFTELQSLVLKTVALTEPLKKSLEPYSTKIKAAFVYGSVAKDSQFDLAYGAAHRLASAALRQQGYRSEDRITVFQTLVHTIGTDKADVQIFLRAHNERNLAEYEGRTEIDESLLADLIRCTKKLETAVSKLVPPSEDPKPTKS